MKIVHKLMHIYLVNMLAMKMRLINFCIFFWLTVVYEHRSQTFADFFGLFAVCENKS